MANDDKDTKTTDPLTSKGRKIMSAMKEQYGEKKGESVFYASKNKGRIKGVDESTEDEETEDVSDPRVVSVSDIDDPNKFGEESGLRPARRNRTSHDDANTKAVAAAIRTGDQMKTLHAMNRANRSFWHGRRHR